MMYNEKLAVAIKSAGKVLREFKDTVYVPFGAEYSILIKNLNSVKTIAKISIDGQYIDETGAGFIVDANSSIELERFLKNGNMNEGNRFKFIERTSKIEDYRGIQIEDGLIRVEFQFEKRLPKVEDIIHHHHHYYNDYYWYYLPYKRYFVDPNHSEWSSQSFGRSGEVTNSASLKGLSNTVGTNSASFSANSSVLRSNTFADSIPSNDAGITVPSSISNQQFVIGKSFPVEETTHVMVLKLLGETAQGKKVVQPVTVKTKQKCPTCGHMNKATAKFCTECGTSLEIV